MKTVARLLIGLYLVAAFPAASAWAQADEDEAGTGGVTGLPLPRFVTLSSGKINMRVGPGSRYPIEWVYTRRGMPVEIVAEYELWRKVRDVDGTEGWVLKHMVSSKRGAINPFRAPKISFASLKNRCPRVYGFKKGIGLPGQGVIRPRGFFKRFGSR